MIDYRKIKKSLWWKSYKLIRQNSKLAVYILMLDLMFAALLYGFSFVSQQILPEDPSVYFQFGNSAALIISISIALVYILIMIFIYSFFKYGVLDMMHSMIRNTKFDFGKLVKFYKLNIVVFGLPFLVFALFYIVTLLVLRQEIQPFVSWIFLAIVAVFAYPYYNIAHTLFTRNYDIRKILTLSLRLSLKKFKNYIVVYVLSILGIGIFILVFYLFGLILGNTVFSDPAIFSQYYTNYSLVFTILLAIVFYKIIFFNRVYFYVITETLINKKD